MLIIRCASSALGKFSYILMVKLLNLEEFLFISNIYYNKILKK